MPPGPADDDGPFFFLSYAHAMRDSDPDAEDQDIWVFRLFKDLCTHIAEDIGVPASRVGFIDREMRTGNEWPWRLSQNLATCRVFVPLYSRRYFQSAHCGKEWFAFRSRALNGAAHSSGHVEEIIPALWRPVRADLLPVAAQSIHFDPSQISRAYAEHGFYGIMKLSRFKDDYEWVVLKLAERIVEVAERGTVPPGPAIDHGTQPSAFEEGIPRVMPGDRHLRIIVAAPRQGDLPPGRSVYHYGQSAREWNPYAPDSVQPLADFAVVRARYDGFRPEVSDVYEQADALLGGDAPSSGAAVLLIDPWAVLVPRCREILSRLDAMNDPWVQPVVIWNRKDGEMAAAEGRLRAALQAAMPLKLAESGRETLRLAVRGVPSPDEIGMVLGGVMQHAGRQYLKYAHGRPSAGPGGGPPSDSRIQATPPTPEERADG